MRSRFFIARTVDCVPSVAYQKNVISSGMNEVNEVERSHHIKIRSRFLDYADASLEMTNAAFCRRIQCGVDFSASSK